MQNHRRTRGAATVKFVTTMVILAGLGAGGWYGYQKYGVSAVGSEYVTKPLERGDIVRTVSATGTIEPLVKTIVGSEVSGNIQRWLTDFNDIVTANQVLAEIDPARFKTARDRAAAEVANAKARAEELEVRYKDAEREFKRIDRLFQVHNASENEMLLAKTEVDAARAAWHAAQAGILSAEATLSEAEVDLERTVIRSPIDGIVIARNIENGQTVAASLQAPELFVIAADLKRMQVNANVSEADIGVLRKDGPATFRVDAYPGRSFNGRISQIRYNANDVDGIVTYTTMIEVTNDDLALRPGMTANVTFEVARASAVVQIPNAALRFDPAPPDANGFTKPRGKSKPTVYVLKNKEPSPVEIETGLTNGSFTELKSGNLKEGDEVIIERNLLAGSGGKPDLTRTFQRGGR
ncbi:MAG: efflux RND transporter periplasmic adaptor subunit [Phycisphaerales bacterium]|nr:efflux RND transporter periplasmic adaptor subunit [Phycisphaerales bacterium]MCB9862458.1 efflux RND transporter periplasmic adaptor subunit [Phycisphaerales bacterium]